MNNPLAFSLSSLLSARRLLAPLALLAVPGLATAQVAYDGPILDRANKWDGQPAHLVIGGTHHMWWCSQGPGSKDVIYYSKKTGSLGPGGWSTPQQVLDHTQVTWADSFICDPSVIRGSFSYNGTAYAYALFFTAFVPSSGGENSIGVAFSNNGINWVTHISPVIVPSGNPAFYGAGMSGVAFHPTTGKLMHAYLDTTYSPILRLNETTNGLSFTPSPPSATQLHAAGRQGDDGQGPDIAYHPGDGHWYAAIKNHDPKGIYDGESRVLRSVNPNDLLGAWQVIGIFNSTVTGKPQNHNPGIGKTANGSLHADAQGWAYVFFAVGQERPAVGTWQIAQGRFRPFFNVSVGKTGNGSGTVTSTPPGINCGTDCSEKVQAGQTMMLAASPAASSSFTGWSGDADCTDGSLTITGTRSCFANFQSLITARVIWVQPQPQAGFGPPGSLVMAGSATGAPAGSQVTMVWRNVTTSGPWVTEAFKPVPDANGIWYHSIPNANYFQLYDVYAVYGGFTSATCRYQGNNTITWCP